VGRLIRIVLSQKTGLWRMPGCKVHPASSDFVLANGTGWVWHWHLLRFPWFNQYGNAHLF
jgi:hypothetical protein